MIPDNIIPKAQRLYDFAVALGYSHASAIGVCANVMAESSFNEGASEVGGAGFGLGQWTPQANLTAQAAMLGYSYAESLTFDVQCDILLRGDETGQWSNVAYTGYDPLVVSPQTLSQFKKETDMISATMNYMAHWERPSYDPNVNHKERRKDYAREFDAKLDGSGGGGDGTQLAVLPIKMIHVTQGENGSYSHMGTLCIDFVGTTDRYPYYAPCDCEMIMRQDSTAVAVWKSSRPVKRVDGSVGNIFWSAIHELPITHTVGTKLKKGELMGHTGVGGNVTGDHLHLQVMDGDNYRGFTTNSQGASTLVGTELHIYNVFSSCNNITKEEFPIVDGGGYPWKCLINWDDGGSTPPEPPSGGSNLITLLMVNALNGWYNY